MRMGGRLRRPGVVVTWILGGFFRGTAPSFESCRRVDLPLDAGMIVQRSKHATRSTARAVYWPAHRARSGGGGPQPAAGSGLHYYAYHYLDTHLGSSLSTDPIQAMVARESAPYSQSILLPK